MTSEATRQLIRGRLAGEVGSLRKEAPLRICLAYPSPYRVAMSSLGYQRIYGAIFDHPLATCERAFLPDDEGASGERPVTYEGLRELTQFPVIAVSVAYELELAGLVRLLDHSGIPALRADRGPRDPFIVAGGPLTYSNPTPLADIVDAVVVGEAEDVFPQVLDRLSETHHRRETAEALAELPHVWVPELHGLELPSIAACHDARLPAHSVITTPHTELSNMFLIETERGCSRGCTYCVMRRSTNGGMRIVPKERILGSIPDRAVKVGLVGAAVSDHPQIVEIVQHLAQSGRGVGLSSLRPDKLRAPLIEALKGAGYKTLTTALDGASERLRNLIERRGREPHYERAAQLAREHGMTRLKLYLMLGLPGETDSDIDECVTFVSELSTKLPIALGISPFCAKRNTPLDAMPYAGVQRVQKRLTRLRRGLQGRADVRATSARWAWVEYVLAQGGVAEGRAAVGAIRQGGRYADYVESFAPLGHRPDGAGYEGLEMPPAPERLRRGRLPVAGLS